MACRGVHFALTHEHLGALETCTDDRARLDYVREVLEPHCFDAEPDALAETDKAWDAIHRSLAPVTRERLRAGYDRIDPSDYGVPLTEQDFDYTWEWFVGLREFWQRAAAENRAVLFTVDQ